MSELIDREAVREFIKSYRHSTDVAFHMEDHLDEIPAASPWHRVEDGLPKEKQNKNYKDFEYVLCATTFGDVRPYKFGTPIGWDEPHFWYGTGGIMDKYVTHWMPLPEPPKEVQE